MRLYPIVPFVLLLAGCTPLPDLGPTYPDNGRQIKAPDLVPIDTILNEATEAATDPEQTEEELAARVAALNAKADRLRAAP